MDTCICNESCTKADDHLNQRVYLWGSERLMGLRGPRHLFLIRKELEEMWKLFY